MSVRSKPSSSECSNYVISLSMSKRIPSHAGESTAFDTASNLLAFAPLSAISPEAQALQDKYLASIRARIDSGSCPAGLRKQYELQLEHIKAQIPSCEVMLVPAFSFFRRKHQRYGLLYSCLLIPCCKAVPDPNKKYAAIACLMNHPLSRGSIVRVSTSPCRARNIYARAYFVAH